MLQPHYFDAHTHVHFAAYEHDWREVIDRALAKDVWMILVGTQRDTSRRGVEVAKLYERGVYAAVALHPVHTDRSYHDPKELGAAEDAKGFTSRGEVFDYDYYRELARDPKVVAIGECGLDYFRIEGTPEEIAAKKEKQRAAFKEQIHLAQEVGKPLMIHCRDAFADLIAILKENGYPLIGSGAGSGSDSAHSGNPLAEGGVIHFFTGTPDNARELLALGFGFTFGGVVTFARDYDEAIRLIPLDKIFSETDAPYLAPAAYRGKRNEPSYIVETVQKLAELKGVSPAAMREVIFQNAQRVFKIGE